MSETPEDVDAARDAAAAETAGAPDHLREETAADAPELAENDRLRELEEKLAAAEQELLYARAETQNVRRRMEKDVADARTYAATSFARDMLSVADNLARGLAAIPESLRDEASMKGLVTGLEATGRELEAVFAKHGIEKVPAMGLPLDPNLHQAMMEIPGDAEPGTIVQELQPGYRIRDRLLRPALVGVAKKPD